MLKFLAALVLLCSTSALIAQAYQPSPNGNNIYIGSGTSYSSFQAAVQTACAVNTYATVVLEPGQTVSDTPPAVVGGCPEVGILEYPNIVGTTLSYYYNTTTSTYTLTPDNVVGGYYLPHGIMGTAPGTAAPAGTSYYSIFGTTVGNTVAPHQIFVPTAIKPTQLWCNTNSTQPTSGKLTLSLGVCTPTGSSNTCTPSTVGQPTVTFAAGAAAGVQFSAGGPTIGAGQALTIVAVNSASTTSATVVSCTVAY